VGASLAANERLEYARLMANTNPHPLPRFRGNGPLSNMGNCPSVWLQEGTPWCAAKFVRFGRSRRDLRSGLRSAERCPRLLGRFLPLGNKGSSPNRFLHAPRDGGRCGNQLRPSHKLKPIPAASGLRLICAPPTIACIHAPFAARHAIFGRTVAEVFYVLALINRRRKIVEVAFDSKPFVLK